jgi:ABC-type dipeptide/oligopeptide/nickel transport system permease subunit
VWIYRAIYALYAIMVGILVITICYLYLKPTHGLLASFGEGAMQEHILTGYSELYNVWRMVCHLFLPAVLVACMQIALTKRWKILFYTPFAIYFIFSLTHLYSFVLCTIILSLAVRPKSREYFNTAQSPGFARGVLLFNKIFKGN